MGTLPRNAVLPTLIFTGCLEFVSRASLISGNFVFIVGFLRNILDCWKVHPNPILETEVTLMVPHWQGL